MRIPPRETSLPEPEPVRVNMRLVAQIGTGLWAVAAIALAIAGWVVDQPQLHRWAWIAFAGMCLGAIALLWLKKYGDAIS